MIGLDLSVGKKELLFGATHTVLGTLLARTVCHLSWREAALWSGAGACFLVIYFKNFAEAIGEKAVTLSGVMDEDIQLAVSISAVLTSISLLAYVSNKGASYLMKVPSNLFAMVVCPMLILASCVSVGLIYK